MEGKKEGKRRCERARKTRNAEATSKGKGLREPTAKAESHSSPKVKGSDPPGEPE